MTNRNCCEAFGRLKVGRPHPAGQPRALAARVERNRIRREVVAERLAQPLGEARFALAAGRPVEGGADIARERKARLRRGHRQPLHRVGSGEGFRPVGLQELEPRRGGGEEIARLDARANGRGAGFDRAFDSVLDHEPQARRRALDAGADFEPRHRGDRGQRLAAEAEGRDRGQVAVRDFRRRVPLDGKREIGFVQPMPVVDDPDQPAPAGLDRDLDRLCSGVERVLDQFLDRRRRPLDHLARGDAVDDKRIETANRLWGSRTFADCRYVIGLQHQFPY